MKYTTKIAIIPFDRYERLIAKQSDSEIHVSNKDDKSKQVELIDDTKNNITENNGKDNDVKYNVLLNIPDYLKRKASLLLNYLNTADNIKWNAVGNVIINGKPIEGSHIVDLVRNAIVKSSSFEPIGSEEFYSNLKHIPLSLIVNEKRLKQLKAIEDKKVDTIDDVSIESANKSDPPGIPNRKGKSLSEYLQSETPSSRTKWRKYDN